MREHPDPSKECLAIGEQQMEPAESATILALPGWGWRKWRVMMRARPLTVN